MRQTYNSLSEEHPDLCSQQNISKSYSNRLYRDNDGISQKGKSDLSHRILALLFLALDLRTERDGKFKKCNSLFKKFPLFLFWFYKQAQAEEGTPSPMPSIHQTYFTSRILVKSFQANLFSCAAIPAYLRVGCILRNLSVALLFWESGRTPFSTAQGSVLPTALPLVNTPVCFPASLLSFTAYSPSHDDSFAFTVVKSHLRFCMHSYCTFCTLKTLKKNDHGKEQIKNV